jgi:glyoxylase-like metal-dependent hydrolase (beta-lactamase superfamily II)
MQVSDHIHAIKIPFKLEVHPGSMLDRFVFAFLIYGKRIGLIDSGVKGSETMIIDYVRQTGRNPHEIDRLVFTHSHPDHIGGGDALRRQTGCDIAAHSEARPWIENVDHQYAARPIANFYDLVGGSVPVDIGLTDGDRLELGGGHQLEVIHTPGHSKGSVCLLHKRDRALFTGDAVPKAGTVPIYEDVLASRQSIKKIQQIKGVEVLMTSWDDPHRGERVKSFLKAGFNWFQQVHDAVAGETAERDSGDLVATSARVLKRLGFPETAAIPIITRSIKAHLVLISQKEKLLP